MVGPARHFDLFDTASIGREVLTIPRDSDDFGFFRPLLQYWDARRAGRIAPARGDIDPLDLPPALLPHVVLIEVRRDPLEFSYRLAGTAADTIHGQSLKGVRVLDLRPESFAKILNADLMRMAEDLTMQFVLHTFTNREGKTRRFRVLRLPLCDAAGRLEMVLVLADHGAIQR
ncbi:hypothetical protein GCM10017083_09810 [Thalassobaculum fulvum]|jgi:hypothetical protein|uniref:PAS domain-containing protein n=1 Tax=Thalassobaculum fulvum TaxID=1633335 RepID=A0A918XPJ1_9PROT|nr:PAS domain-containing protein [Thalassobaculum fulvum]GHD43522.1 hypothetical protein GCM10017083_09810 [Thalassobaculum fulvum]